MAILRYKGIRGSENFYLKIKKKESLIADIHKFRDLLGRKIDTRSATLYVYHILPQKSSATQPHIMSSKTLEPPE